MAAKISRAVRVPTRVFTTTGFERPENAFLLSLKFQNEQISKVEI